MSLYLKLTWEGTFEYDVQNPGHHWKYGDRNGDKGWGCYVDSAKRIEPYIQDINNNLLNEKFKRFFPDLPTEAWKTEVWKLVRWLAGNENGDSPLVSRPLSLILNAIVKDATLQTFKVLSSFVEDNVTVEIKGLRKSFPNWFYLSGPGTNALSSVGEVMLFEHSVVSKKNEDNGKEEITKSSCEVLSALHVLLNELQFSRALHKYSIVGFEKDEGKICIRLRDEVEIVGYERGKYCGCIPIPGKGPKQKQPDEPKGVNAPEVVVSSPVVVEALKELSRIWQDPFAKSVLISAPPGSGKEVFAISIPYGNNRPTENLETLSLATDDQPGLLRQLYGREREDGSIEEGLIAKAAKSALFLDEVHQPEAAHDSAARASLLRPLESDEFFPVGSNKRQDVPDVLFIMATSKKLEELSQFKPPDFWTRMTHALAIKHPLDFTPENGGTTLAEVLTKFFNCFWWDRIEKRYRMSPIFDSDNGKPPQPPKKIMEDQTKLIDYWQVYSMSKIMELEINDKTNKQGNPKVFAETFIKALNSNSMKPADFSVRGIRNMVTRLFSIAAARVSQGEKPWEDDDDKFGKDVENVFTEILKVARLK
jgi:hypothetical protein